MHKIKHASLSDIPLIRELTFNVWPQTYAPIISKEQIDFMLTNRYSEKAIEDAMKQEEKFFLAYADNIPVAYAALEWKEEFYYLHKFYLDVSKHRGGIGKEFFNYLLTQIDSSKSIRLQVNRQNFKAVNFYFKAGFQIESIGDFDIGGGYFMNDFVMRRH